MPKAPAPMTRVRRLLEDFAERGVFRGFSRQPAHGGVFTFKMTWHHQLVFELLVEPRRKTISIPRVLPGVPAELYTDFKEFVREHHAANLPLHRRIETTKARLRCANHRGRVSLTITVKDGDYEYALQRLIHLVHETFLIFLANGAYRDYRVEQLGVDPDWG